MAMQGPTFTAIKLSLLFLYRRLFLVHQKWLRIAWWANLIYVLLWAIGATGFYVFQCWPVGWYWNRYYERFQTDPPYTGRSGQCHATTVQHVAMALIFGLVSDVALLCLPIIAILKLRITTRKKAGLAAIFDGVVIFLILSVAEEVCAILCSSLPVVLPILYQSCKNQNGIRSSSSQRKVNLDSTSRFTKFSAAVVPALGTFGTNFRKLDEESESIIELKPHGAARSKPKPSVTRTGSEWPLDNNNIASYSVAATETSAKAEDVVDRERDIVVKKEVHVTAFQGDNVQVGGGE
ncbi:MAG: hypothetical protein Q9188_007215 [Gyalolechia gomerana]